jgi:hypothetical protein
MPPRKRARSSGGGPEQPPTGKRQNADVEPTNDTGKPLPRSKNPRRQARPPVDVEELAKVRISILLYRHHGDRKLTNGR